ncbi:MAG: lipid IV(A) 3-deoxy-D-manno-octulosonic acid transferase [Rhizobiaceae bacterium]|nr:lipid IV(A) 3-deoxy-D-manno-octulosonic acid transferase [Rhizobiaceae bacterium]
MSNILARTILSGYRWTGAALYPLLGPYLAYRAAKGKEERDRRSERYGRSQVERPNGPLIWFHAASVGETIAVIPLIEEVVSRNISVVLTTGTVTSANICQDRLGDKVIHQYVPLDLKPAISNFLDHWRPDLAIISESEIWPMTILELGARRMPQILVNGRMSDKSFARWSRSSVLAEALFENLSHVIAQSDLDGERFSDLGARSVSISGNLKVDTDMPPFSQNDLADLKKQVGARPSWAAISTFEGEETLVADALLNVKNKVKNPLAIIVPRHVERSDSIEKMLQDKGLKVARRSRDDKISADTDVFIGDTTGEMGLYLSLTKIVFVGKSLSGEGGQNPLEPAMLGCAILSGPNVQNFRDSYRALLQNGAARIVKDGEGLTSCLMHLLENEDVRDTMIEAGQSTLLTMRGSLDITVKNLEPYLSPLMIESSLLRSRNSDKVGG